MAAMEVAESQAAASAAKMARATINNTNSAARIASPDSRSRNSADVPVRPVGSSQSRSFPSTNQQSRAGSSASSLAATVERANAYQQRSSSPKHLPASSNSQHRAQAHTGSNNSRGQGSQNYNNGRATSSTSSSNKSASSTSKNDLAQQAMMAQQMAALMSMGGGYGSDPAAMALQMAAMQQLLMYGSGGSGMSNSNATTASRSSAATSQAQAANSNNVNAQLAAMNMLLNPASMYNFQQK